MNYNFVIRYRKSEDHANCDMLSRLPRPGGDGTDNVMITDEDAEAFTLDMETVNLDAKVIARETRRDPILSKVCMWVLDGFPKNRPDNLQPDLIAYWNRRDTLNLELDCLTWGNRVIIPSNLRNRVLDLVHASHIGTAGMKAVARSFIYWPGLDQDINLIAKACSSCNKYGKSLPANPEHPWIRTTKPWQRIHVDFADFGGKKWLLLQDSFT